MFVVQRLLEAVKQNVCATVVTEALRVVFQDLLRVPQDTLSARLGRARRDGSALQLMPSTMKQMAPKRPMWSTPALLRRKRTVMAQSRRQTFSRKLLRVCSQRVQVAFSMKLISIPYGLAKPPSAGS
jgi:hypothetical protein